MLLYKKLLLITFGTTLVQTDKNLGNKFTCTLRSVQTVNVRKQGDTLDII